MTLLTSPFPKIQFDTLQQRVVGTKTPSTARYYRAMLKRLADYTQSDELDLARVDAEYVAGFGRYLIENGVTLSTVRLYKTALRATMKEVFGPELKPQFKAAFKDVESKNEAEGKRFAVVNLKKIVDCDLSAYPSLDKIRKVFLYCVISGGIDFKTLKESFSVELAQQRHIVDAFEEFHGSSFKDYVENLSEDTYLHLLKHLGYLAKLVDTLSEQSSTDAWMSAAKMTRIPADVIATILPDDSAFTKAFTNRANLSDDDRLKILKTVANVVIDLKPRWFVMRCLTVDPNEVESDLRARGLVNERECFSSFIPPKPHATKGGAKPAKDIMSGMFFFSCTLDKATEIRKAFRECGWVYTRPGTTVPAPISDMEMKTFMLLCNVSEGTIALHFSDEADGRSKFKIGRQAKIVDGIFAGRVGVITDLPDNKYKVVLSFTTLSATITAEIPAQFIRIPNS